MPQRAKQYCRLIFNVSRTLWAESTFPHLTERIVGRRDTCVLAFSQLKGGLAALVGELVAVVGEDGPEDPAHGGLPAKGRAHQVQGGGHLS